MTYGLRGGIVTLAVIAGLPGCYRSYSGFYDLNHAEESSRVPFSLAAEVRAAITPLGFRVEYRDARLETFVHARQDGTTVRSEDDGSDADVRVTVVFGDHPRIVVSDPTYSHETELVRRVKAAIEERLAECCGIHGLKFERAFDWLA